MRRPDWRRARIRAYKDKVRGLGAPLGDSLPEIKVYWLMREKKWEFNTENLAKQFPGIFSNHEFFNKLPRLGGEKEGEARHLHLGKENEFISSGGIVWHDLVIKKFRKGAVSSPEKQAKTLHSMNIIKKWLIDNNLLPKFEFEMKIAEAIAKRGPFLVMRYVKEAKRLNELPKDVRRKIWRQVVEFGRAMCDVDYRIIRHFKEAGLVYPSPDFIPSNILARVKDDEVKEVWIIDQFTPPGAPRTAKIRKIIGKSMKRIYEKRPTTQT